MLTVPNEYNQPRVAKRLRVETRPVDVDVFITRAAFIRSFFAAVHRQPGAVVSTIHDHLTTAQHYEQTLARPQGALAKIRRTDLPLMQHARAPRRSHSVRPGADRARSGKFVSLLVDQSGGEYFRSAHRRRSANGTDQCIRARPLPDAAAGLPTAPSVRCCRTHQTRRARRTTTSSRYKWSPAANQRPQTC
jgi:hypothetical protein